MRKLTFALPLACFTTLALLLPLASAGGHTYEPTDLQCTGGPVFGFQPCGVSFYIQDLDGKDTLGAHFFYTDTEPQCLGSRCTPPLPWCTDWGFVVYDTWRDYQFACAIIVLDP